MSSLAPALPGLPGLLKELHLPAFREGYQSLAATAEKEQLPYAQYLLMLAERECAERRQRKIERLLRQSRLPLEKTFRTFDLDRLSAVVQQTVNHLLDGTFVERRENVLAFGNPGSGKTHLVCALGHHLAQQRRPVYFTTCSLLVQELLAGKRDLKLARTLKKLSRYQAVVIDDIGYVQHDREEMEVLFTFLAERYERGSVLLTSNLPFSKWEQIFKDPMTTAAAIDRLVHHSVILELNLPSYRLEQAAKRKSRTEHTRPGDHQKSAGQDNCRRPKDNPQTQEKKTKDTAQK